MALSTRSFSGQLVSDEEMLVEIQQALLAVAQAGQSYTMFGSRMVTSADISTLQRLEAIYRRRVLAANGDRGRNTADVSDSTDSSEGTGFYA